MVVAETRAAAARCRRARDGGVTSRCPPWRESTRCAGRGCAAVWEEHAVECVRRLRSGRRGGDRRRVRARRARRAAGNRVQPRDRRADGAARRGRRLRRGDGRYTLHAGSGGVVRQRGDLAGALGVPETEVRVIARDVGGNYGTRNSLLSGVRAGRVGGEAPGPAGQVDVRPARGVPDRLPRPRPRVAGGAGARRRRAVPRAARRQHEQCRRTRGLLRPAQPRASRCRPACTTSPPRPSAAAPCSPTRRRRRPIAAPGGPR